MCDAKIIIPFEITLAFPWSEITAFVSSYTWIPHAHLIIKVNERVVEL